MSSTLFNILKLCKKQEVIDSVPQKSSCEDRLVELIEMCGPERQWLLVEMDRKNVGNVNLPWHIHDDIEVIEYHGTKVKDFDTSNYGSGCACCGSVDFFKRSQEIPTVILSMGKIDGVDEDDGYDGLHNNPNQLYHIDGLHRMIGYYNGVSQQKLRAYVAW